jgi:predicted deacetylase
MKILYHPRTASKDGKYVHIKEMIEALRSLGHEVIVVAPAAADNAKFGDDAGTVAWLKHHMARFIFLAVNAPIFAERAHYDGI